MNLFITEIIAAVIVCLYSIMLVDEIDQSCDASRGEDTANMAVLQRRPGGRWGACCGYLPLLFSGGKHLILQALCSLALPLLLLLVQLHRCP